MSLNRLSVAILTKNSQKHLSKVLNALEDFGEVLLLDSGSTDKTLEVAKQFSNVRVEKTSFTNFGHMRNQAAKHCHNSWILVIDSDEVLSKEAKKTLEKQSLNPHCVYSFPFKNFYGDKWIYSCGWHPDRHIRLYHKDHASYQEKNIHENLLCPNSKEVKLQGPIKHYSYSCIRDFLHKMQLYSELFATQYQGKKFPSTFTAILHSLFAFFKSYLLKRGFLQGYEGFLISCYQSLTALFKYLKLREYNQQLKKNQHE